MGDDDGISETLHSDPALCIALCYETASDDG